MSEHAQVSPVEPAQECAWTDENIVFVFSLPRAGSTLLQRILATHPSVSTGAESWLLLPQLYALRHGAAFAEYGHARAADALADVMERLPGGVADYHEAVRVFAVSLFQKMAAPGTRLFVEKTPRNALVLGEILHAFPRSKYIFLWRNPLAVSASLIETFGQGRWNLHRHRIDLYQGLAELVRVYESCGLRACALSYENLVSDPVTTCTRVFAYVGLDFDPQRLTQLARVPIPGRMGDPKRVSQHELSTTSVDRWNEVLRNPLRRIWARRYLRWIGQQRLATMGYRLADLETSLDALPMSWGGVASDCARMLYGVADSLFEVDLLRAKWRHGNGFSIRHS